MLRLQAVEAGYGSAQVLFGVSFAIEPGACVSLMGRNGMGKTTTVRVIMGQLPLVAGTVERFGNGTAGRGDSGVCGRRGHEAGGGDAGVLPWERGGAVTEGGVRPQPVSSWDVILTACY